MIRYHTNCTCFTNLADPRFCERKVFVYRDATSRASLLGHLWLRAPLVVSEINNMTVLNVISDDTLFAT